MEIERANFAYGLGQHRTAKQIAARDAIGRNPRQPGELKTKWAARVASIAGCSAHYVMWLQKIAEIAEIGKAKRAAEERADRFKCDIAIEPFNVGQFTGWLDTFGKLRSVSIAFQQIAIQRQDTFAASFLAGIVEQCERAQRRALLEREKR